MGLRCLIGHDFGEPQIERDRDEQGDEVVVTIREFKECARCGHRRTVSENKEVTSLASTEPDPAADSDSDSDSDAGSASDRGPGSNAGSSPGTAAAGSSGESLEDVSAAEDDGIILEDDSSEEATRGHGEWPAADVEDETASVPAAATNGEVNADGSEAAESTSTTASADDAESTALAGPSAADEDEEPDATVETDADEEASARPWPHVDEDADEGFDAEASDGESPPDAFVDEYSTATEARNSGGGGRTNEIVETAPAGSSGSGIASESPGPTPGQQQRETPGVETELTCPSCDHTLDSAGSSLRPGDICPECGMGYLAEREAGGSRNR